MTPTLQTERLTLRPVTLDDAAAFFTIFSHEDAMRFMPTPPHQTVADTTALLREDLGRTGAHYWAICEHGSDAPLGHVHYLGETRAPSMGYILHPDVWGRGYVTEACRAALAYGFEQLAYDRVELWIDERNAASRRVAERLGFSLKGRIPLQYRHRASHHFMLVYGLLAVEWGVSAEVNRPTLPGFFGVEPILPVRDVATAAAYYRDSLGFNVDFLYGDPPNHASVSRGEWTGSLVVLQLTQLPPGQDAAPPARLYIRTGADIDALYDVYRAAGVNLLGEPTTQPWGMREFAIRDPDGHILIFGTHR